MSVKITQPIPPNVVEIGNEITQNVVDGLMSANPSPSSANPYLTVNAAAFLPLAGGTISGVIDFTSINGYDAEVGAWGFGTENTDGRYATLEPNLLTVRDGATTLTISATGGITFPDNSVQTTAASGDYLPLAGGTMTEDASITFNNSLNRNIYLGNFIDSYSIDTQGLVIDGTYTDENNISAFAKTFISPIEIRSWYGNEDEGLASKRFILNNGGFYCNSNGIELYLNSYYGGFIYNDQANEIYYDFTASGITFPDSSVQTTAGIPEAPIDGNAYVRKNGAWVDITTL